MHPFPEKPLEYDSPNPTESYTNLVVPVIIKMLLVIVYLAMADMFALGLWIKIKSERSVNALDKSLCMNEMHLLPLSSSNS